jgi:hypothetical protein
LSRYEIFFNARSGETRVLLPVDSKVRPYVKFIAKGEEESERDGAVEIRLRDEGPRRLI